VRLAVLFVVGCHFAPAGVTGNGSVDAAIDSDSDAMIDGPRGDGPPSCVQRWLAKTPRLTSPVKVANVNTSGYERDPFVSADELSFYVSTDRGTSDGSTDIYLATRATAQGTFGAPAIVASLSVMMTNETKVSMTANGLYAVLGSTKSGGSGGVDVWEASRPTTTAAFGPLGRGHVMNVETSANDHDPEISADGLHLYIAPDGGGQHIVVATRANMSANFGAPTTITEIMDPGNNGDGDPTVSPDERLIVFSSNRVGTGKAGGNLWYAVRDTPTGTFSTPIPVPDINTDANDGDAHISADGCRLYYGNDGDGDWNVYVSTMM
jgi:Tol biopolymer transport system component